MMARRCGTRWSALSGVVVTDGCGCGCDCGCGKQVYKRYRNVMITSYRENPGVRFTSTDARRELYGSCVVAAS
jgi:hypothetical protein